MQEVTASFFLGGPIRTCVHTKEPCLWMWLSSTNKLGQTEVPLVDRGAMMVVLKFYVKVDGTDDKLC